MFTELNESQLVSPVFSALQFVATTVLLLGISAGNPVLAWAAPSPSELIERVVELQRRTEDRLECLLNSRPPVQNLMYDQQIFNLGRKIEALNLRLIELHKTTAIDQPFAERPYRRGLENYGTTCYINSVLKAISTTPLLSMFHPDFPTPRKIIQKGVKKVEESDRNFRSRTHLKNRIWEMAHNLTLPAKTPADFKEFQKETFNIMRRTLSKTMPEIFASTAWKSQQQDAEEFLRGLLNEYYEGIPRLVQSSLAEPPPVGPSIEISKEIILPLYLSEDNPKESLSSVLKRNLGTRRFVETPETLIVQLSRFDFDVKTQTAIKKTEAVIPDPVLRVPVLPSLRGEDFISYHLKGVISHIGPDAHDGHYIYFEYRFSDEGFWIHDDDHVHNHSRFTVPNGFLPMPQFEPFFRGSYLLFYERVDAGTKTI